MRKFLLVALFVFLFGAAILSGCSEPVTSPYPEPVPPTVYLPQ